jgi:hypothetical protein
MKVSAIWLVAGTFIVICACDGATVSAGSSNDGGTASGGDGGPSSSVPVNNVCAPPRANCKGICTDLSTNQDHCGACTRRDDTQRCDELSRCMDGECVFLGCVPELETCDGICSSFTDAANCGSCSTRCGPSQVCSLMECKDTCALNLTACNGSCVDLTRDRRNCGSCGKECETGCVNGICSSECPAGWGHCVAGCRALDRDPFNCGLCGNACAPGEACVQAVCRRP